MIYGLSKASKYSWQVQTPRLLLRIIPSSCQFVKHKIRHPEFDVPTPHDNLKPKPFGKGEDSNNIGSMGGVKRKKKASTGTPSQTRQPMRMSECEQT